MFEVLEHGDLRGAFVVRGSGGPAAGQVAVFSGPQARERAEAYARWRNTGAGPVGGPDPKDRKDPRASGETGPEG